MAEGRNKVCQSSIQQTGYTRASSTASMNRIVYPHHTEDSSKPKWHRSSELSGYKPASEDDFSYETTLNGGFFFKVYNASITHLNVEAIVNATNGDMDHAGGVAKVIADDAGHSLEKECKSFIDTHGPLKVGQNMVTTAGTLPYQAVIHAVGPLWKDYRDKVACLDDLYDCVYNILHRCKKSRYRSVAMTAISAGAFAVPKELCADMYVFAAANYSSTRFSSDCPKELHIVDIDTAILHCVEESVIRWKKDPESLNHRVTIPIFLKDNPHLAVFSNATDPNATDQRRNENQGDKESNKDSLNLATNIKKLKEEIFPWGGVASQYMFDDQFVVKIYEGDSFKVKHMDAIVCGVEKDLELRGKIADTLRKCGGQSYEKSYQQMINQHKNGPPIQYSDVYKCDGGRLEAKHVLHAVLKRVVESDSKETKTYQDCMASVLATVKENRWEKVTIPLIGTGIIQTNNRKLKGCGTALLKALDEFIVINGDKSRIKEIHLVNYKPEVNIALVEVFDEESGQQISSGNETYKRNLDATSGKTKRNGYFRRHSTRGRVSYCKGRNSFCKSHKRNSNRVESQEDKRTCGLIDQANGFPKSEDNKKYSKNHTEESVACIDRDFRKTIDVVQDKESKGDSDGDAVNTCMANNTKRFEGNLNIIDG